MLADEFLFEGIGDLFVNDKALGGDAGLTIIDDARFYSRGGGFLKICAGHNDEGIAAAEFQDDFFNALCGGDANLNTGLLASGESGRGHSRIVEDAIDLRRANEKSLEHASRETGAEEDVFDFQSALRDIGGVFQQADVAGHQAGSDETEDLPEREVPGHDGENDAERLVTDEALGSGGRNDFVGDKFCGVLGVITAAQGALFGFGDGGAESFAHFEGHEAADWFLFGFENVRGFEHPAGAIGERGVTETLEGFSGFGDFFVDLRIGERVKFLYDFAGGGIDGGNGHERMLRPRIRLLHGKLGEVV